MSRDEIFYQIIAHLNDLNLHGNQGLYQTSAGLVWVWEGQQGWDCQWFGEAKRWPNSSFRLDIAKRIGNDDSQWIPENLDMLRKWYLEMVHELE